MFALPKLLSLPVLGGLYGSVLDWPAIGPVLAWFVIAAFVGVSLGFLRELTSGSGPRRDAVHEPRVLRFVPPEPRGGCEHREAA